MGNFLGVGIVNAVALGLFIMLMIVVSKVLTTRYPVKGVTEFVNAI